MDLWWPPSFDRERWRVDVGVHVDAVLARLCEHQHGVAHHDQLITLGVTPNHLRRRRESGHCKLLHHEIYVPAGCIVTPDGRRMGAVLVCGSGARLAGWSLASHAQILPPAGHAVDVVIPPGRRVVRAGIAVRRVALGPGETTVINGIPCTTIARMLLDLAATADRDVVEWAWRQAIFRRLLDIDDLRRLLAAHRGDRGVARLRELYLRRARIVGESRNRFEVGMLDVIRDAGLPEPQCNEPIIIDGIRLHPDFLIPQAGLIIEFDGRDGHADPELMLADEQRDRLYRRAGLSVKRYGWWNATRERDRVVNELRAFARQRADVEHRADVECRADVGSRADAGSRADGPR